MASEEESNGRIRFEISDWDVKNEFNPSRSTQSKRKLKNLQIYGSFAESDSDDQMDTNDTKPVKQKGINFISGGLKDDLDANKSEEMDDNEEVMTFGTNKSKSEGKSKNKWNQEFAGIRRTNAYGDEDFGRWESHTRGIGAKLLKKMGHQPGKGLGKNLQGITAPVEAKKRAGFGAIGLYGSEHKHKPLNTDETFDDNLKTRTKPKTVAEKKKEVIKRIIKSTDQIIREQITRPMDESELNSMKVIDMTGPEQRILAGYHEIGKSLGFSQRGVDDGEDDSDLLDVTEKEILELTLQIKRESNRLETIEEEIHRIQVANSERETQISNYESILKHMMDLNVKMIEKELSIDEMLQNYDQIRNDFPEEFYSLRCYEAVVPMVFPLIRCVLQDWNPLTDCESMKQLFIKLKTTVNFGEEGVYELLLWELWMPVVRRHICELPSIRQCDEVINLLDSWRPLLPVWLFENIIEQIVLPLIQKEVEEWNPLTDTVPIHSWLHPWLPLLVDRSLEHLYDPIRHKLANALKNWYPSDGSAKLILEPWKGVFSAGAMEAFLNINIVPKLEIAMQTLTINPHQQCLDVWHWVMSWQDLLSTTAMATILEKSFFGRWLNVLYNWLSNGSNLEEVSKWYSGWKSMISPQLLDHPSIKDALKRALDMMNAFASNPNLPKQPFNAFYAPIRPQPQTTPTIAISIPDVSVTFKQLVQRRAEEKGILFMPIKDRLHEGKQVHKFGKSMVYIDRQVLFTINNNKWVPTSLQTLLDFES